MTSSGKCSPIIIIEKPEVATENKIYVPLGKVHRFANVTYENGTLYEIELIYMSYKVIELPLIYFPHLIAAGVCVLISLGGYLKDRDHALITNILLLVGPVELVSYAV